MQTCWLASGRPFFDNFKLNAIADGVVIRKEEGESLWIYEEPIAGREYVLWCDPAEGLERGGREDDASADAVQRANTGVTDFSAFGVADRETNEDVAVFLGRVTPGELARMIDNGVASTTPRSRLWSGIITVRPSYLRLWRSTRTRTCFITRIG